MLLQCRQNAFVFCPVKCAPAAAVPCAEIGSVLEEHFDNLELLAQSAGSSACARGLNGEMERRRATFVELGVNSGARFEQLANGRWPSPPHRTMQRSRPATIDMLN